MQFVGRIGPLRAAQAFSDYLRSQNVAVRLDVEQDAGLLYAANEHDLAAIKRELDAFIADPNAAKYQAASWQTGETQTSNGAQALDLRHWLSRAGVMTKLLVGVSVLLSLLTNFGENALTELFFISTTPAGIPELLNGQLYRLVTPIFLHFMLLHLLFNMMWLWDLGGSIERRFSGIYLVTFVFTTGLVSNLAQFIMSGPFFGGMSGVGYALIGFVWVYGKLLPSFKLALPTPIMVMMLGILMLCFTGWLGPVGNAAHISGLFFGLAWGFFSAQRKKHNMKKYHKTFA